MSETSTQIDLTQMSESQVLEALSDEKLKRQWLIAKIVALAHSASPVVYAVVCALLVVFEEGPFTGFAEGMAFVRLPLTVAGTLVFLLTQPLYRLFLGVMRKTLTGRSPAPAARAWVERADVRREVDLRVIEGPELKRLLLAHPMLIDQHFHTRVSE